ncbi:MAG: pyridoxal phosphate-dependent decarboxylase family protein [Myxococcales bacterium]
MHRELFRRAAQLATEYLESLPERPVGARATREELVAALGGPLPERGEDPLASLDRFARAMDPGLVASAGPRYFGFVTGAGLPAAMATDWLASAWNQNVSLNALSPAGAAAEEVAIGWILELLGLPQECSVGFVTGGQTANFTCLLAARNEVYRRAGWDVERDGLLGAPPLRVVAGAEAHISVFAALRMLGFGTARVELVEADAQGRMIAAALRRTLAARSGTPTIVCAQAGNVNSGAFDPVREIVEAAHAVDAWVHVDGAFGLWAAASPRRRVLLAGAHGADSWATDGHKWLNVPYDCGIAITAHPRAHRAATTASAAYLTNASGPERNPFEWVPEASRRGRALPVYVALRTLGRAGVSELVDRCCALAARMASALAAAPGVRVLNEVVLNQALVRFGESDDKTREVIARVQRDGTCWVGGTNWHGMHAMRLSVSGWSTTEADVDASVEAILRAAR